LTNYSLFFVIVRNPIPLWLKPILFLLRRWLCDPQGTPATPFQSLVYYTGISTGSQRDQTDLSTAPSSFRARLNPALGTFLLLIGLNLINFIDRYILPGAQPLIQREFHATDQQMGALTTAMFVFYMFAAPLRGWLGARSRRKPLIIAGAVLWSLATLATVWVHGYWTFYMRQAFVGVGEATFSIFAPA